MGNTQESAWQGNDMPHNVRLDFILKLFGSCTALTSFLSCTVSSHADSLPSEFLGRWMSYDTANSEAKCNEAEGVIITAKDIEWTSEGGCRIGNIKLSRSGGELHRDHIEVIEVCSGEGEEKGHKDVRIWSIFKIKGETFMSQASTRNVYTDLFKKCD